jgi:hypothetical protein
MQQTIVLINDLNKIFNFFPKFEFQGVTNLPPLKLSIVLEIQMIQQKSLEILPSILLLFPR